MQTRAQFSAEEASRDPRHFFSDSTCSVIGPRLRLTRMIWTVGYDFKRWTLAKMPGTRLVRLSLCNAAYYAPSSSDSQRFPCPRLI
jgi:hypothetical protein